MLSVVAKTGRSASLESVLTQTLCVGTKSIQYVFDHYKMRIVSCYHFESRTKPPLETLKVWQLRTEEKTTSPYGAYGGMHRDLNC
jgi:hypothetical protein